MIRTRDFFLYALALIFICGGIGFTTIKNWLTTNSAIESSQEIVFKDNDEQIYQASYNEEDLGRPSILQALKEKIARGEGIDGGGPVLTTVDEGEVIDDSISSGRVLNNCPGYAVTPGVLASWPPVGVTVAFTEGVRRVSVAELVPAVATASPSVRNRVLIDLPIRQVRNSSDTCVDNSVVGVSNSGSLLINHFASNYLAYSEFAQIGYARDGFPIYGTKSDDSDLDACGGKQEPSGYRYYLRGGDNFIIGCFAGTPSVFNP